MDEFVLQIQGREIPPSLLTKVSAWSPTLLWLLVLHTRLLSPGILLGRREGPWRHALICRAPREGREGGREEGREGGRGILFGTLLG